MMTRLLERESESLKADFFTLLSMLLYFSMLQCCTEPEGHFRNRMPAVNHRNLIVDPSKIFFSKVTEGSKTVKYCPLYCTVMQLSISYILTYDL